MRDVTEPYPAHRLFCSPKDFGLIPGFTIEADREYLHYVAVERDIFAVSEVLYKGANRDHHDSARMSPLYLLLVVMTNLESDPVFFYHSSATSTTLARRLGWHVYLSKNTRT